jgi:PAS domain S-box-containing protein
MGLDSQLRIIEVNDNFLKFFKVKKDMLMDRKVSSTDLPLFTEPEQMEVLQNAVKGKDANIELEIMIGDEHHYFRCKLIPTILADGRKGVTIILENVDQQKVAQRLVKDSEEKFKAIYQAARDAMIITDDDRLFECNQATLEMFGCDDVEFLRRKFHFFSPPLQPSGEDSQTLLSKHQKKAREKGLARFDWVHRRFDGSDFQTDTIITPIELYGKEALLLVIRDISERKEMEAALRDNEERYRTLFESSPDAVLLLEGDRIIQCNSSTLDIFGLSSIDQVIGKHPADLSPPFQPGGEVSRTKANKLLNDVMERGNIKFGWEHLRKGAPFSADVSLATTRLNDRTLVQATIRDITKIRTIQEDLRRNEARLRNILSSLHGAFIGVIDRNFIYNNFWGSPELDEKYGLKSSKIIGSSVFQYAPPGKEIEFKTLLERVFNTGEPVTMEVEGVLPKGKFFQAMTFSPYRREDGTIEAVVQFATDTTEKHNMLERLKETERLYKLLDDNVDDVIWMTDATLDYTYLSSSTTNLVGYSPDELIGQNISSLVTERSMNRLIEHLGSDFTDFIDGKPGIYPPSKMELELRRKDGTTVWTEVNVNTLTGPDDRPLGTVGITRDITKRRQDQKELEMLVSAYKLTSDSIIVTDLDGHIQDVNDAFLQLVGVEDRNMVIGMDGFGFLVGVERGKVIAEIEDMIKGDKMVDRTYSVKDMLGNDRTIDTTAVVLKNEMGEPRGFLISARSRTDGNNGS